jgi:hypothetical protein
MTLITRLSTAFTDASLPKLRIDPVLTDAGSLVLYDFKAKANQAAGFNPASPQFVNLGTYAGITSITPLSVAPSNYAYDQTKGAIVWDAGNPAPLPPIAVEANASAGSSDLFNTTDDFLVILWASRRATNLGGFFFNTYLGKGTGNTNSGDQSFYFMNNGTTPASSIRASINFNTSSSHATNSSFPDGPSTGGNPVQLAMHWFWNGSAWEMNAYSNKVKAAAEPTSANPMWLASSNLGFFRQIGGSSGAGSQVHRLVIENLTASGRTAAEVLALDYAYSNGRFSS